MWCRLAFHGGSTQIKGGILTVKCSKLSELCWKQVKPERLLIGQVPMIRWSNTISWSWITLDDFNKSAVNVGHIFTSNGHECQVQGEPEHRVHTKLSTAWEGSPYTDVMFGMPVEMEGDKEPADYARQQFDKLGVVSAEVHTDLWGCRSIRKCIMTSMLGGENSRWEIWSPK